MGDGRREWKTTPWVKLYNRDEFDVTGTALEAGGLYGGNGSLLGLKNIEHRRGAAAQ